MDAASVVKTEAAGSVDKTLPSSSSSQPAAAAGSVDKTLPATDSVKSVAKTRITEFEEKSADKTLPHNPLDGVKKETPALRAWEETKKRMKEKKEEQERQARQAAGESTPPDWNMSSSSSSSSSSSKEKKANKQGTNKAVDKTVGHGTPATPSEHGSFDKREPGVSSP